jgi:hypothetical protein
MIFCRDRDSGDGFDVCHDEIVIVGVDFIGRRSICGLYLQGGAPEHSQRGHLLWVIGLVVNGHEEINIWR